MTLQFNNHVEMVDACEQLASDLVDFKTDSAELRIEILKGEVSESTKAWLELVCVKPN